MEIVEINENDLLDIVCKHPEYLKSGTTEWYVTYNLENHELAWSHNSNIGGKIVKVFSPLGLEKIKTEGVETSEEWREFLLNAYYIYPCTNELYEFEIV